MARYLYASSVSDFLVESDASILGRLLEGYSNQNLAVQQNFAWQGQLPLLRTALKDFGLDHIFLEFSIPRMGKRADAILYSQSRVIVIEFKMGDSAYFKSSIEQVEDYALDLKNFHEGSHHIPIIPVLVASEASFVSDTLEAYDDRVYKPLKTNASGLYGTLEKILINVPARNGTTWSDWANSRYKPTPTIIQAAQALYDNHSVEDISRSEAGAINLAETSACINQIIHATEQENSKSIVFLTGVPGAGKTLAGLNIATQNMAIGQDHSVFLSGNGPLVDVLREALAQNLSRQGNNGQPLRIGDARRRSSTFIQNIHHFRDLYIEETSAPADRVVVFDEAQRAWTKAELSRFMKVKKGRANFESSEPQFLLDVMNRHETCTIVCLIGGGQEINRGEAGLDEWVNSVKTYFSDWKVYYSPSIIDEPLYLQSRENRQWITNFGQRKEELHLKVSVRSFRSEKLAGFVEAVINNRPERARTIFKELTLQNYPICLSRSIENIKQWLKIQRRGSERSGLVASSGALRLRKFGIWVKSKIDPADWFLKPDEDVRSSLFLEEVATEFDIQGLELDWVGMCWDADFYYLNGKWIRRKFKGTRWQSIRDDTSQKYLVNAYRVLLTRARQGMIIYVPFGDPSDKTRIPEYYDGTYQYLKGLGIQDIDDSVHDK